MKLETNNQAIEVSGGSNTGSFSIAMNGKAFRVLSDTLYQNKIGSVVREISCNAYDAHVAAGKPDVPFVVHLPDNFEPWFAVQDFGVGLSEDQIKNVFTVYFQSTKDESNDSIGAFGLGAKTPFSYTDQFTVTSVCEGMKRIYSAFIGPAGVPDMQLMHSAPSTESNGVEIKMSVRSSDFNTFYNELKQQLRFFKVKPIVKNCSHFEFEVESTPVFENEHIAVYERARYGGCNIYILQGIVGYKMEVSNIQGKLSAAAQAILNPMVQQSRNVVLKFNIGEIGVTASREGVEYNKTTVANIEKKLLAVGDSFSAHLKNKLQANMTLWEKALWVSENNPFGTAASVASLFPANTHFLSNGKVGFWYDKLIDDEKLKVFGRLRHVNKLRFRTPTPIEADRGVVFLIKDKCTFFNLRIKKFFDDNKDIGHVYVIESAVNDSGFVDPSVKDKLTARLGDCPNVFLLSSIEMDKQERAKLAAKRKSTVAEWYLFGASPDRKERQFTYVEDITDKKVYVYFEHGNYYHGADIHNVNKYFKLIRFVDNVPELIAVKISQKKEVEENKNLISLETYMKDIKEEDYSDLRFVYNNFVLASHVISKMNIISEVRANIAVFEQNAPDSKFVKAIKVYDNICKRGILHPDAEKAKAASEYFGWTTYHTPSRASKFLTTYDNVLNNLPLLREYMKRPIGNVKIADLVNYVKYVPH